MAACIRQAGFILRYAALRLDKDYQSIMFSSSSLEIFDAVASIGFALFVFLIGVKMDVSMVFRTGKRTFIIAVLSFLAPVGLGMIALRSVSKVLGIENSDRHKIFRVILFVSTTSFHVIVCVLEDIKIINSELGRLGLSTALLADILSIVFVSLGAFIKLVRYNEIQTPLVNLASLIGFIAVVAYAIRPALSWVVRQTPEGRPVKNIYLHIIVLLTVGSAVLTFYFGRLLLLGPFILGLAIPDGPPLGSTLADKLDSLASGIFLPLFVTSCSMKADLAGLRLDDGIIKGTTIATAVAFLAKFAASLIPSLFCKMPKTDAVGFALIMISTGSVDLGMYTVLRDLESITEEMFALSVLIVLLPAIFVPIIVKCLYDPSRIYAGYQKRDLMHCKPNSELRILPCIYRPDDIPAMIHFLEVSFPAKESPLAVYVLHLIKLWGRACPLFISHQKQKMPVQRSYSENVIVSFRQFEEKNPDKVLVHIFTAISPPELMHADICTLALDKLASLIILPFHRKWFADGTIESENDSLRALNRSVLERAPCSVGILIDRGCLKQLIAGKPISPSGPSFYIFLIFFGGNDDREAITLAKRMARDPENSLTVVRFIAESDLGGGTDWEKMQDSEVLKDLKPGNNSNRNINYVEEVVGSGEETARIIQSMVKDYNLVIVGRRYKVETPQTSNLHTLGEFSELGLIGDFLAPMAARSNCSLLVMQHQRVG